VYIYIDVQKTFWHAHSDPQTAQNYPTNRTKLYNRPKLPRPHSNAHKQHKTATPKILAFCYEISRSCFH